MVQTSMCCIYPGFSALYFRLEPLQQTALIFVLPIIKIIIQSAVVWFSSHVEEYIPGITVFSVEVFNALYLTKCMQGAKSVMTYVAIMMFDVLEMVLAFVDMKGQISNLQQMHSVYSISGRNLLETVSSVCEEPGVLDGSAIHLRSPLKLRILNPPVGFQARNKVTAAAQCSSVSQDENVVEKQVTLFAIQSSTSEGDSEIATKRKFVHQSLEVLFQCEYHVQVEYVESVIPMIYSFYVAVLCELPSAKHYPETRDLAPKHVAFMALNVMLYAWMKVLSLIALHFIVKRKFGFSPIYVLAFVLENQSVELQARLTIWFAYVLQLTLVHFGKRSIRYSDSSLTRFRVLIRTLFVGVDFTLQFAWIQSD